MSASGLIAALLLLATPAQGAGEEKGQWVIRHGREAEILSLVAPYETLAPVEPGTWFLRIGLTESSMDFVVLGRDPPADPVTIKVRWEGSPGGGAPTTRVSVDGLEDDTPANLRRSVELLHGLITERLTQEFVGSLFEPVAPNPWGRSKWAARVLARTGTIIELLREKGELPEHLADHERAQRRASFVFIGLTVLLTLLAAGRCLRRRLSGSSAGGRPGSAPALWPALLALPAAALAVRVLVEPSLANWYSVVLPPEGRSSDMRFGPMYFIMHEALRALGIWSDGTLFLLNACLGALAVLFFTLAMGERRISAGARFAAALCLIVAPLHVRISASSSEHVLSSTLTVMALWLWLRALNRRDLVLGLLALSLLPLVAFTRAEAWVQLAAIPLWGLLRDRGERLHDVPGEGRLRMTSTLVFWLTWALLGLLTYDLVVQHSQHPGPTMRGIAQTARNLFWQYLDVGFAPPYWFSPAAVLLAAAGLPVMAFRRPRLLAGVLLTLVLCFVPLGRNLQHDGILGSRYFLLSIPVFLVMSGYGWEAVRRIPARLFPRGAPAWWGWFRLDQAVAAAWAVALLVALLPPALTAYRATYAFQAEYRILRGALAEADPGCVVTQIPVRAVGERDLDCCLDVPRTPLTAAFPDLEFRNLPDRIHPDHLLDLTGNESCVYYYAGATCSLVRTGETKAVDLPAMAWLEEYCGALRMPDGMEAVRRGEVPPVSTNPLFGQDPVPVTVYRWSAGNRNP